MSPIANPLLMPHTSPFAYNSFSRNSLGVRAPVSDIRLAQGHPVESIHNFCRVQSDLGSFAAKPLTIPISEAHEFEPAKG